MYSHNILESACTMYLLESVFIGDTTSSYDFILKKVM